MSASGASGGAILFLCVANSARSQMAEGLARQMLPAGTEVFSAGSAPTSVHPCAVAVMREIGIDIRAQRSKRIEEVPADRVGTVVTLCAEEACPAFLGNARRLRWPLEDPADAAGSQAQVLAAFRRVREQIRDALAAHLRR